MTFVGAADDRTAVLQPQAIPYVTSDAAAARKIAPLHRAAAMDSSMVKGIALDGIAMVVLGS